MRHIFKALFVAMIISLFIIAPTPSYAVWNGNGQGHNGGHHDGGHGRSFVGVNFSVWPNNYYYAPSYYPPVDEVLVSPPIYQPVIINGTTYYLNGGTYYVYNGYGYQAIAPPVTVIQQPAIVEQPPAVVDNQVESAAAPVITPAAATSDTAGYMAITLNIPNNKGGYTAVILKESGNGFTGPQGEFYQEFPKVSQLEIMYGK